MKKKSLSLKISSEIGNVSAECFIPEKPIAVLTMAHGAGANMNHAFMVSLAEHLGQLNIATMRFNFPFMENKKGRPDSPAVAHQVIATAIKKAQQLFPDLPLFISGKSFGGRMSSQYLSENANKDLIGIIFYGFPLHPAGKPSIDRAEHLKKIKTPMLFLQGTKDTLATWDLIESVTDALKPATLIRIEGADHSFKAGKRNVIEELAAHTEAFIKKKIKK